MNRKLVIKRLTASDLTLFEWQYRNINAGNQKSINLNRDVFIDKLYPALPEIAKQSNYRIPLDLNIFGPGTHQLHNVQRKIIKQPTSYKNWRLNGEFIYNPDKEEDRYNQLKPGDFALFEFFGDVSPSSAKLILIASAIDHDQAIYTAINNWMSDEKMAVISPTELQNIVDKISIPNNHPIFELLLDAEIEDAAFSGFRGIKKLNQTQSGKILSNEELQKYRNNAEEIGESGELLVNSYLEECMRNNQMEDFTWVSAINAIAPYDFEITETDHQKVFLDVKSTSGPFIRTIHISINELIKMADLNQRYDIYRVYNIANGRGTLRISKGIGIFAEGILDILDDLPNGVLPDTISVDPTLLVFGEEITLESDTANNGE